MQGGFSFCGVDIAKFGLEYVPPLEQTYVFGTAPYEVQQESFDAHNGGYFYGTTVRPKDFTLKCLYQNQNIAHGVLTEIENFFRRGKTGKLVFDKRNWLWYTATVVDVSLNDLLNYRNGFVTITMRAYYPFARHDYISIGENNMFHSYLSANSGLLSEEETPPVVFNNVTRDMDILLYNGGTERAGVAISLAGDAKEGITITNKTTGQEAKFIAFTKATTSEVNKTIVSDAINGKTVITDGVTSERSFLYHDYGFIDLEPSYPIERNIYATYIANSNQVNVIGAEFGDDILGRHIRIDGAWLKITGRKDNTLQTDRQIAKDGSEYTNIVTMNEIHISLSQGAELTRLQFIYKPTFQ